MEHLINKNKLVSKIKELYEKFDKTPIQNDTQKAVMSGDKTTLMIVLEIIDSLECKTVENAAISEQSVRKIVNLHRDALKHLDDSIIQERKQHGFSQLLIDLIDKTKDPTEMSINFIMEHLDNKDVSNEESKSMISGTQTVGPAK